jgi:hypothetical protein
MGFALKFWVSSDPVLNRTRVEFNLGYSPRHHALSRIAIMVSCLLEAPRPMRHGTKINAPRLKSSRQFWGTRMKEQLIIRPAVRLGAGSEKGDSSNAAS